MVLLSQKTIRREMDLDQEHKAAKSTMLETCVLTDREFTLASGRKSRFYVDCRVASCHPVVSDMTGSLMQKAANRIMTDSTMWSDWVMAPVPMGGLLLVGRMMMQSSHYLRGVPWVVPRPERKGHGRKQLVEGLVSSQGKRLINDEKRVLVIEDVVTSGGSSLRAVEVLREEGLRVEGVLALVDRQEGAQEIFDENDLALWSVFQKSDFVQE